LSSSSSLSSCCPPKCLFANEAACAYVKCCLDQNVQEEYGVALGLIEEGGSVSNKDWSVVGKKRGDGGDFFGGVRCDGRRRLGHPCEMTKGGEYR
jgi:hypothetical protein